MSIRKDLVKVANAEWTSFGKDTGRNDKFVKGKRKETVEPYASRVGDYWLTIPTAQYDNLVKSHAKTLGKLDGTINIPWSAAFISYCMQQAGAGTSFPYSSGHATWIVRSIKNKKAGKLSAPLVGFKPGEIPLAVGDIVGKPRQTGITYDNAVTKGWFISHTDIVVEIDLAKKVAYVIGGNVGQSVSKAEVAITADGKLKATGGWMVHIQNNIASGAAVSNAVPKKKIGVG